MLCAIEHFGNHWVEGIAKPWENRPFCSCGLGGLLQIKPPFFSCRKLNLKNTSLHKNNIIYIIKQEGLYQNKVNSRLVFIDNCKLWPFCYWSINSSNVENESTQPPPISNPGVYAIILWLNCLSWKTLNSVITTPWRSAFHKRRLI